MPVFVFTKADTLEETVDELINRLAWLTSKLDSSNINRLDTSLTGLVNKDGETIVDEYGNVYAKYLSGDIVVAQTLYAENGYISRLVVDELLTEDKVQKYLASNTDDVNYIHIYDQYTDYKTASYTSVAEAGTTTTSITIEDHGLSTGDTIYNVTRSESRVITVVDTDTFTVTVVTSQTVGDSIIQHAENNEDELLYWTDDTYLQTTIEVTDYPTYIYIYSDVLKMQLGFIDVGGTQTPVITLGAGSGTDDYGKGFIYKGTDGLEERYYSATDGSIRKQIHTDDDVNHIIGTEIAHNSFTKESTFPTGVAEGSTTVLTLDVSNCDIIDITTTATVDFLDGYNYRVNGASAFNLTFPDITTMFGNTPSALTTAGVTARFNNKGSTTVTFLPSSTASDTMDGTTSYALTAGSSVVVQVKKGNTDWDVI